jgi:hypothetical protein
MKRIVFVMLICWSICNTLSAQNIIDPANLTVPQSSAFKLMDVSPELIESPGTPKAFGLGILQSFNNSSLWPQNYSASFSPYWWVRSDKRSFFNFAGIDEKADGNNRRKYHPFNDIKFTDISVAFLQKNVIPDSANTNNKIFSVGFRTTILKIYQKDYATELGNLTDAWHKKALKNMDAIVEQNLQYRAAIFAGDTAMQRAIRTRMQDSLRLISSEENVEGLVDQKLLQKPILQWDIAGAYAVYGIGDTSWQTGRSGAWTTLALNVPLSKKSNNYLSFTGYARYMYDAYALNEGILTHSGSFEAGGKVALTVDAFKIGVEAIHRNYQTADELKSQRVVGVLNYRVSKSFYVNAAFGNDFGMEKPKILAMLGISLGLSKEALPF